MPIPEIVKVRARLSPFDDFKFRTLSALPGLWNKFLYLVELRSKDGKYEHWGYSRVHGQAESQAALAKLHAELYLETLRTPIRDFAPEWRQCDGSDVHLSDAIMVPADLQGGSPKHFNSVLLCSRLLTSDRPASTHSGA